jgi:flagellin-like hook-associated protein FlgL
VAQSALARLGEIAEGFAGGAALRLGDASLQAGDISLYAAQARQALVEVGTLLNTRHEGDHLFGGSDAANPPGPDPEGLPTGGMAGQVAAAVATLGGGGGTAATVAAATRAAATDDSAGVTPFSAFLASATGQAEPRRGVPAGDGALVEYGLFANRNAGAASAGETTGSWARDLLRGLASIAALTPAAQAAAPAEFTALAGTIRDGLKSAASAIAGERGGLGVTEAGLEAARTRHAELGTTLEAQLAGIQEVDLAATLTRLQATRTALEASYTAIGRAGSLSLVEFLR